MDINEAFKLFLGGALPQVQQAKQMVGLGLNQAANTIGQDAQAGLDILNDPRNSWIGMGPVGKAAAGGLGLLGIITSGAGKYAQFGLPEVKGLSMHDLLSSAAMKQRTHHMQYLQANFPNASDRPGWVEDALRNSQYGNPAYPAEHMVPSQVYNALAKDPANPVKALTDHLALSDYAYSDVRHTPQEIAAAVKFTNAFDALGFQRRLTPESYHSLIQWAEKTLQGDK
jgi:hypothetical protein